MEATEKLNPIHRIAQELEPHSSLSEEDIERSLVAIIELLQERAEEAIEIDPESPASESSAMEFLAFTELVATFGGSLLAYDEATAGVPEDGLKN